MSWGCFELIGWMLIEDRDFEGNEREGGGVGARG